MKTKHLLQISILSFLSVIIKTNAQAVTLGANSFANNNGVSIGTGAGQNNVQGTETVCVGNNAGRGPDTGSFGEWNTFVGGSSGSNTVEGIFNTFLGYASGNGNETGDANVFLGSYAGSGIINGNGNVCIGPSSGPDFATNCSNNIFIGNQAGFNETGSNKLIIGSLISGDAALKQLKLHSKVNIGGSGTALGFPTMAGSVSVANYGLFVNGGILTEEVRISLKSTWADYVFKKDYKLPTLEEVENQIKEKGHLPNVPSAEVIKENGLELGEMAKIQQEKIEELTLYIIEQNKVNQKQNKEIAELKTMLKSILDKAK